MTITLIILCLGNIIDVLATLYLTSLGYQALNPLMAWLLQWPVIFVAVKAVTVIAATIVFWYAREMKTAIIASRIVSIYYAVIAVYYVIFLMMI